MTKPAKKCGCGRCYSLLAWYALPQRGRWEFDHGITLDMRDCACGSTLAVTEVVISDVEVADVCAA